MAHSCPRFGSRLLVVSAATSDVRREQLPAHDPHRSRETDLIDIVVGDVHVDLCLGARPLQPSDTPAAPRPAAQRRSALTQTAARSPDYNGASLRMSYFRPAIDNLSAYRPGEQPAPGVDVIKLNTNENPHPPSARALAALRSVEPDSLRRYPRPFADEFRESAATVLGVAPDWVLVGNGSDDLLTMLLRSVADSERPIAYPMPTYVLYRTLAQMQDAPAIEVPFDDTYTLPTEALAATGAALTLVASPNSPSGNRTGNDVLASLAARLDGILAIDEAYVAFASGNALALTRQCENVIVLRTLSKSHSLAGLRLGFAVAQPTLIGGLAKVKDSYNVGAVSARVGAAAIRDTAHTQATVEQVCASRERLSRALSDVGFRVWPSEANFLLVRPPDGDASGVYRGLKAQGILVRFFDEPMLRDKLRITVGTDDQNDRLMVSLKSLSA